MNLFYLWVVSKTLLCGCNPDKQRYDFDKVRSNYTIDKIASLPPQVTESSGLASTSDRESFWTHNDSGSLPELFRVGLDGTLIEKREFSTIENKDWEDLAQDNHGKLFIGDFGNNSNSRRNLAIHVINEPFRDENIQTITFRYGLQTRYPEEKKLRNFDCEAFFYHRDSLYLFSKNTGKKPRYTLLYKMPAVPGDYTLFPADSIRLNETVTSADISPDGKHFVLLTYGKVFFFDIRDEQIDFSSPARCLRVFRGQTEAIMYSEEGKLLITNEKGKVFRLSPK